MPNLFCATLGQRPEAITIAYDRLCERYEFERRVVLTTDSHESGIADSAAALDAIWQHDYPATPLVWYTLAHEDGAPLLDILDAASAMAYFRGVYAALAAWKQDGYTLHCLISGGRKAMSVYATLAAGLVFGTGDHLWTVLSSPVILKPGMFHVPPSQREQVQVVELPLLPARIIPGSIQLEQLDMDTIMEQRGRARTNFMRLLTDSERAVAELLTHDRYLSNQQLAEAMRLSRRTVETHLLNIYTKLASYVDFGDQIRNKRQALIDFLREGL